MLISTCWVEDTVFAGRLIEIWESITKSVSYWERLLKSKQPSSKSFLDPRQSRPGSYKFGPVRASVRDGHF